MGFDNVFENKIVGATIPNEYIGAVEKGFHEACEKVILFNYNIFTISLIN